MSGGQTTGGRDALDALVQRVAREVRWRRAEYAAIRGGFWGAAAGVGVLALKVVLGGWTFVAAGAVVAVAIVTGAAAGFARRVPAAEAARLADRAFGLKDRVATALEWSTRPDRTPLVDALIADAVTAARSVQPRPIVRRIVPREARWLPVPALVALSLVVAPPMPLPRLPDFSPTSESEETRERTGDGLMQQQSRPLPNDALRRPAFEERDFLQRGVTGASPTAGDLSAVFKDTSLASQRPDFNSFLKKGDERLKMLEQVDRLPDLQSDFTASQYKMVFRKAKSLTGGLRPDQISPQKLRELLEEMQRLGRRNGGAAGSEISEGMEALEYGQQDRALEAMEKALDKLRAMEEQQRSGKGLRGGRESGRDFTPGRDGGRGSGPGGEEQDFGEGEGFLPGKGRSAMPKGEASQRLRANPYDAGVEGESRKGRKEGYDTNMTGRAPRMPSRMTYLGVIGQYRKMMEDAIAREQVPRDYHEQIKEYFQALDER
jgi:hypothetical protein